MGNAVIQPCTSEPDPGGTEPGGTEYGVTDSGLCVMTYTKSKSLESLPVEGKVVIRPIAFKPVASAGVQGGVAPQGGCGGSLTGSSGGFLLHSTSTPPARPPDPRYTSTPTLARGGIHHYGSMGDLKTMSNNSCSLDRRGLVTPLSASTCYDHHTNENNNKYNSLTKL
ncbi:hypothetical protein OTU49_005734, partial [Cherax quadricarinatus]